MCYNERVCFKCVYSCSRIWDWNYLSVFLVQTLWLSCVLTCPRITVFLISIVFCCFHFFLYILLFWLMSNSYLKNKSASIVKMKMHCEKKIVLTLNVHVFCMKHVYFRHCRWVNKKPRQTWEKTEATMCSRVCMLNLTNVGY